MAEPSSITARDELIIESSPPRYMAQMALMSTVVVTAMAIVIILRLNAKAAKRMPTPIAVIIVPRSGSAALFTKAPSTTSEKPQIEPAKTPVVKICSIFLFKIYPPYRCLTELL